MHIVKLLSQAVRVIIAILSIYKIKIKFRLILVGAFYRYRAILGCDGREMFTRYKRWERLLKNTGYLVVLRSCL